MVVVSLPQWTGVGVVRETQPPEGGQGTCTTRRRRDTDCQKVISATY